MCVFRCNHLQCEHIHHHIYFEYILLFDFEHSYLYNLVSRKQILPSGLFETKRSAERKCLVSDILKLIRHMDIFSYFNI